MRDETRRRAELADFLKTRRARLHPEQLGLPTLGRRRTPGLRRDEVAQLAGVSVSWYTWLEQGRDIIVSDQVLDSLARILQLDTEERNHLFLLARDMVPVANTGNETDSIPAGYQAVLDALGTSPARLLDERFNVIAWNASAHQLFGDFSQRTERERNAIWNIFTNPAQRKLFVHWERSAQNAIMLFRTAYDRHAGEAWYEQFVADLKQASPEFRAWWPQHDIQLGCDPHEKELDHPLVGRLFLYSTTLVPPEAPTLHMAIFTPLTRETASKLARLLEMENSYALTR